MSRNWKRFFPFDFYLISILVLICSFFTAALLFMLDPKKIEIPIYSFIASLTFVTVLNAVAAYQLKRKFDPPETDHAFFHKILFNLGVIFLLVICILSYGCVKQNRLLSHFAEKVKEQTVLHSNIFLKMNPESDQCLSSQNIRNLKELIGESPELGDDYGIIWKVREKDYSYTASGSCSMSEMNYDPALKVHFASVFEKESGNYFTGQSDKDNYLYIPFKSGDGQMRIFYLRMKN